MQSVGLYDVGQEQQIRVAGPEGGRKKPFSAILASAVTLASGDILVTGGVGREREVYLLAGSDLTSWTLKTPMTYPRSSHASARIVIGREEKVLAAGGWDSSGEVQATVEIYTRTKDVWETMPSLPTPRVDFALKVKKNTISQFQLAQIVDSVVTVLGGYYGPDAARVFPKLAVISWSKNQWGVWQQSEGQEKRGQQRSGFMSTEVPLGWIKKLCGIK